MPIILACFCLGICLLPLATIQKLCDTLDVEPASKRILPRGKPEPDRVERRNLSHAASVVVGTACFISNFRMAWWSPSTRHPRPQ
jgi:hypothetical protein